MARDPDGSRRRYGRPNRVMRSDDLFRATLRGRRMTIGPAAAVDLTAIAGPTPTSAVTDVLRPAMLVAIHASGFQGAAVHAVGWRRGLADVWATSALVSVDLEVRVIVTSSGNAYFIPDGVGGDLHPRLYKHLAYALQTWGCDDIRPTSGCFAEH